MRRDLVRTTRFHTVRNLGHGATSRVFEVEDRVNGGRFALKQLRDERLSAELIARFKDEFRALERISHPNVAKVYELLADDSGVRLLMELVEGVDFISYVRPGTNRGFVRTTVTETGAERSAESTLAESSDCGKLDVERLRDALAQLAAGLRTLHASGSIHCDVKPENVLVTNDGRVVIVDFGLLTEAAHESRCRGTPAFMAPEQFAGTYSEATDWYAVGMLLYAAFSDRLSLDGSPSSIARTRLSRRPVDPRMTTGGLPDDLVELSLWLLEPDPARRPRGDVIARILGVDRDLARAERREPTFVGRTFELERLGAAFAHVQRGHARVVHLHGESGIGKTSLLGRFASLVEQRGGIVFRGSCYRDASVPYKALDTIMDRIAVNLAQLELSFDAADRAALALMFPVFRVAPSQGATPAVSEQEPLLIRAQAVMAFRRLLTLLAEKRGIVLCIDDMQWTDLDSIELLANLMHPPAPPGVLLVLGYRSTPEGWGPRVQVVRRDLPCHDDLALGPLATQEVRALVETRGAVAIEELETILRESAGNPFFVGELVRLRSAGSSPTAISLGVVLSSRMNALAPKSRAYLELVSASGRPLDERVLRRALGISQEALLETRRVLIAESLVRIAEEEGRLVEPYHDRIREHLLHELAPERLRARHGSLAEAHEAEGASDPEVLAIHYRAAGDSAKAIVYAERAGDAAAQALAFDRAADLFGAALELAEEDERAGLLVKHAKALSNAGRSVEAARAFVAALVYFQNDLELKLCAGEEFLKAGQIDPGLGFLSEVAQTIGLPIPRSGARAVLALLWHELKLRRLRVRLAEEREISAQEKQRLNTCITIARQLLLVDPLLGAVFQRRYLQMALSAGIRVDIVHALAIETGFSAMLSSAVGSIRRAEKLYQLATELSRASDTPFTRGLLLVAHGTIELANGRWRSAGAAHEAAAEVYRDKTGVNLRWDIAYCQNMVLAMQWMDGDFVAMRHRLQRYMLEASGYRLLETLQTLWGAAKLALCDDDPAEARRIIAATMAAWPAKPWRMQHFVAVLSEGEVGLYEGNYEAAWHVLTSSWRTFRNAGFHLLRANLLTVLALRARVALALGKLGEAERSIRALRRHSEAWAQAMADALSGCLLAAQGHGSRAMAFFEAAIPRLAQDSAIFAIAARHRLAALSGDGLAEQMALDAFRERGVRAPDRLVQSFLPLPRAEATSP